MIKILLEEIIYIRKNKYFIWSYLDINNKKTFEWTESCKLECGLEAVIPPCDDDEPLSYDTIEEAREAISKAHAYS